MSILHELNQSISLKGFISVSEFMEIALYSKKYGYYTNNVPFYCDFVTAPEISQLFGETIAIWIIYTWEKLGKPMDFILVEGGAGLGTMMFDIIRVIQKFSRLYEILRIYIIEISPLMRFKQEQKLNKYHDKVMWVKYITDLPKKPMIFVANEFFDAFPINQYIFKDGRWQERVITFAEKSVLVNNFPMLIYITIPIKENFSYYSLFTDNKFIEGSILEHSFMIDNVLSKINEQINHYSGAALIIDYGYLNKIYFSTLQSVKDNKYSNVLENIGESDISSWVDFSNFKDFYITTQRDFLFDFGIRERLNELIKSNRNKEEKLVNGFTRLTDKEQMGELFKVAIKVVLNHY